jgi:hypothetical protein
VCGARAQEGLAMVDDGDPDGVRRYWIPALAAGAQAGAEPGGVATAAAVPPPA